MEAIRGVLALVFLLLAGMVFFGIIELFKTLYEKYSGISNLEQLTDSIKVNYNVTILKYRFGYSLFYKKLDRNTKKSDFIRIIEDINEELDKGWELANMRNIKHNFPGVLGETRLKLRLLEKAKGYCVILNRQGLWFPEDDFFNYF